MSGTFVTERKIKLEISPPIPHF